MRLFWKKLLILLVAMGAFLLTENIGNIADIEQAKAELPGGPKLIGKTPQRAAQTTRQAIGRQQDGDGLPIIAASYGPPGQETLINLLADIKGNRGTVILTRGNWQISRNLTIPANIAVRVESGAVLDIAKGVLLSIKGDFEAGLYSIFAGGGLVALSAGTLVKVPWFTQGGDGSDRSPWTGINGGGGIGEALAQIQGAHVFALAPGRYLVSSTINVNRNGVILKGLTEGITYREGSKVQIDYRPNVKSGTLFNFDNTTNESYLWHCALSGVYLSSSPGNHTAIKCIDTTHNSFRDIVIYNWHGTGIDFRGRELATFERLTIYADVPIIFNKNPKYPTIDVDATVFRDMWIHCKGRGPESASVTIADGVNLTNLTFEGHQGWSHGRYGLYWRDTTSKITSQGLFIKNVKMEQPEPKDGYSFYIERNYQLSNLVIQNCSDYREGGFAYLRKVFTGHILDCKYWRPGNFIDAKDCYFIKADGSFTHDKAKISVADMKEVFSIRGGGYEKNPFSVFLRATDVNHQRFTVLGTNIWTNNSTLPEGGELTIPGFQGSLATIMVSTSNGAGECEGGNIIVTRDHVLNSGTKVSGTTRVVAGLAPNSLCVFRGNNSIKVRNNLGEAREVQVVVFWN